MKVAYLIRDGGVISLNSQALFPWEKGRWHSIHRRLVGLQSQYERGMEKRKSPSLCRKSKHDF